MRMVKSRFLIASLGNSPLSLFAQQFLTSSRLHHQARGLNTGEEPLRVQNHGRLPSCFRSFSLSYNAFDGPVRNKMAARCLLSGIPRLYIRLAGLLVSCPEPRSAIISLGSAKKNKNNIRKTAFK